MMTDLELKDILKIVKGLCTPPILLHTIQTLFFLKKNSKDPQDILNLKL